MKNLLLLLLFIFIGFIAKSQDVEGDNIYAREEMYLRGDSTMRDIILATPIDRDSIIVGGKTIRYNQSEGIHEFRTGKEGTVWQGALEDLVQLYNNTGITVANGTPFFFSGTNGDTIATIGVASANLSNALSLQGLVTGEILNGDWGFGAVRGKVRGLNTLGLSTTGALFLSNDSLYTQTKPAHPSAVVVVGGVISVHATEGIIYVSTSNALKRQLKTKSYSFTSSGLGSGEHWVSGFYDASATSVTLTQVSLTQTYGTADVAYEAHPFAVCGGVGSVTGGGVVALVADGTGYVDATGAQLPAHVDTIISDISLVALNEYYESEKYLGTTTYRLTVVSGSPSAYSLTFNYGYAKYDDINDRDFYITGIECLWTGNATDATGFDIELYKHTSTGWTYAASGFLPGNSVLAQRSVDQASFLRVTSDVQSAWKRTMIDQFIEGSGIEGYVMKVTTGANSTIQIMDIHIEVAID